MTLRALGSDVEEIREKLGNTKVSSMPKSILPLLKDKDTPGVNKVKKRLREHQEESRALSR